MSLRNRLLLYLAALHAALAVLAAPLVMENRLWLLAVEAGLVVSLLAGMGLVRSLFSSLDLLGEGARFLDDGEFTTRFIETGRPELDRLVRLYNRLANDLRDERAKLLEQHHFLNSVLDASPSGVVVLDFENRVTLLNPAAARLFGPGPKESWIGRPLSEAPEALVADLEGALATGPRVHATAAGGRVRITPGRFTDRGHERGFLLLEELTAELRAAEKTAYEKLIRMVAHEVGNSVAASGSLLQSSLVYARHLPGEDRGDFEAAMTVCLSRLSTLNGFVRDLAEVVRLPEPRLQPCDLGDVMRGTSLLLRTAAVNAGVSFDLAVPESLPAVRADRAQIEQAFLNIAKNAIEAAGPSGWVTIEALASGEAVSVSVANSSAGLPEDVKARLFTPFFSTKADGRGLGLTLVREILLLHEAPFALDAPAGGPTRFTFTLRREPRRRP